MANLAFDNANLAPKPNASAIRTLSLLRGVRTNVPLAPYTWFRVGGVADYFFEPPTLQDLHLFLKERPRSLPYVLLGAGSNVLIRDGGVRGVVISLKSSCETIIFGPNHTLDVGAAVLDKKVAKRAYEAGIGGLSFLYTIPGTIGGALRMNAGAFGKEMADVLEYAVVMDNKGNTHYLSAADLQFSYRRSQLPADWIFVSARLKGKPQAKEKILEEMESLSAQRRDSQPTGRTGGSTFKNPLPHKAWELLDAAGFRGLAQGDAQFSEKHCNFMLNKGNATADDLEKLGLLAQEKVAKTSGVQLEWEIQRLGEPLKKP